MRIICIPSQLWSFMQWLLHRHQLCSMQLSDLGSSTCWNKHVCCKLMTVWYLFFLTVNFPLHLNKSSVKGCHLVVFKNIGLEKKIIDMTAEIFFNDTKRVNMNSIRSSFQITFAYPLDRFFLHIFFNIRFFLFL